MAGIIATGDPTFDILYTTAAFGYVFKFGERLLLPVADNFGDTSDFLDNSIEGLTSPDGVLRALPLYDSPFVWGWNKRHFAAIGEDPDNPPDTYDELFALAPKFKAKGIIPCVQPWLATQSNLFAQLYWTQIYNSTGHPMFSDDRTQVLFDGDDGLLTFETIEKGIRSGWWDRQVHEPRQRQRCLHDLRRRQRRDDHGGRVRGPDWRHGAVRARITAFASFRASRPARPARWVARAAAASAGSRRTSTRAGVGCEPSSAPTSRRQPRCPRRTTRWHASPSSRTPRSSRRFRSWPPMPSSTRA